MCWKKRQETEIKSKSVYLGFGINDYLGSANDLSGCVNDINDEVKKLNNEFPEFQCLKYFDSKVTTQFFISEIQRVFKSGSEGFLYLKYSGHGTQIPSASEPNGYNEALYLYNGPLIDDVIYKLQQETPEGWKVLAKFDSCFSGDMGSKNIKTNRRIKNRFYPMPGIRLLDRPVNRFSKTDPGQRWIIISSCGEEQTSADAWFDGRANGAFSYFDFKSYFRGTIYNDEVNKAKNLLHLYGFGQVPEPSGPYDGDEVLT